MKKDITIRKHSSLIQTNIKELTLIQRKLINYLIYVVQKNGYKDLYETNIHDLKKMCNISITDTLYLKNQFRKLSEISIEFNYLNKDKQETWQKMTFLASVEFFLGTGKIEFEFSKKLIERIIKPKMYSALNIVLIAGLRSSYSVILYEFLRDYLSEIPSKHSIPFLTINQLKELMGININEYKLFQNFKVRVLDVAIKEINEKADISCNYKLIKMSGKGQKITGVQFYARKQEIKKQFNLTEGILTEYSSAIESKPNIIKNEFIDKIPEEIIAEIPEKYRISSLFEEINKKVKEGKAIDYIGLNLRYAFKKAKENPLYYAINALNKNYAGFDIEIEAKKAKEKKAQTVAAKDNESQKKREEIALDIVRSFPPEKYDALYDKAKELNATENPGNPFFMRESMIEIRMAKLYMENSEINSYQNNDND